MNITFDPINDGLFGHYRDTDNRTPTNFQYHNVYELYYFLEGDRNYLTHSKVYPLSPNWITLTRPYVVHGTNGNSYKRLLIFFSEDFLAANFAPALIDVFHEVFSVDAIPARLVEKNPRIKELFYLIVKAYDVRNLKMAAIHLGELLLLLYDLVTQTPSEMNTSTLSSQMQEILTYVSNNLQTIKTLDQVAAHFFVSKYHLSHQFKNVTGFTFIEFLTKIKISRSLHLLKHTNDNIVQISEACGFETPAYFCIVFKKKMNMTPLQYRAWIIKKQPCPLEKTKKKENKNCEEL